MNTKACLLLTVLLILIPFTVKAFSVNELTPEQRQEFMNDLKWGEKKLEDVLATGKWTMDYREEIHKAPEYKTFTDENGVDVPDILRTNFRSTESFCGPDGIVMRIYSQQILIHADRGASMHTFQYPNTVLKPDGKPLLCTEKK